MMGRLEVLLDVAVAVPLGIAWAFFPLGGWLVLLICGAIFDRSHRGR